MNAFWEIVASNSLVFAVLAACVALLGRIWRNPAGLHLLWVFVLLKLVTPPVVTVPVPLPINQQPMASVPLPTTQDAAYQPPAGLVSQEAPSTPVPGLEERRLDDLAMPGSPAVAIDVSPSLTKVSVTPWLTILVWIWGTGIILLASGRAYRILRFQQVLRTAEPASPAVFSMAEGVGQRLGLRWVPEIAMLPVRMSPLVWSLGGRPRVFLPVALFERLDARAQETILAHELAHVRRKDHWVRLLVLIMTTLFWWHPVVWWACRNLRELEEQCCDDLVLVTVSHGPRAYAAALLDTLDFLSESSLGGPVVASAIQSPASVARRIKMLKTHTAVTRLTVGRLLFLAAVAAVPMAIAFGAAKEPPNGKQPAAPAVVQRRAVNKLVKDFPEKVDLSTPESAQAAWFRALARMDAKAVCELGAWTVDPRDIVDMERVWKREPKETALYNKAQLNTEILEVDTYREDLAAVISKLKYPEGVGRDSYSARSFGKINGVWKNFGEDQLASLVAARENFGRKKEDLWQYYVTVRESLQKGRPVTLRGEPAKRFAPIRAGSTVGNQRRKGRFDGAS